MAKLKSSLIVDLLALNSGRIAPNSATIPEGSTYDVVQDALDLCDAANQGALVPCTMIRVGDRLCIAVSKALHNATTEEGQHF